MEKHPCELLFVLVISFVCLPLPLADTSCRKISGTFCSKDDDREIMRCCLEKYKQGFDTLEKQQVDGKQPPSCRVDLVSAHLKHINPHSFFSFLKHKTMCLPHGEERQQVEHRWDAY